MLKKKIIRRLSILMISISLALLSIVLLTVFEYTAVAEVREHFTEVDQQDTLAYGKLLFETRGCASCHSIEPEIESLAPNLYGVSSRQTEEYIRESIVDPDAEIVSGYEDVIMPDFSQILDEDQINALVGYVITFGK
ncbi:MAG: cytochrome c [Cytophagales bacterium]|nr:cytochrome c [Cytophagales bacterium]